MSYVCLSQPRQSSPWVSSIICISDQWKCLGNLHKDLDYQNDRTKDRKEKLYYQDKCHSLNFIGIIDQNPLTIVFDLIWHFLTVGEPF